MAVIVKAEQRGTDFIFEVCDFSVDDCPRAVRGHAHRFYAFGIGNINGLPDPTPMTPVRMKVEISGLEFFRVRPPAIPRPGDVGEVVGPLPLPLPRRAAQGGGGASNP